MTKKKKKNSRHPAGMSVKAQYEQELKDVWWDVEDMGYDHDVIKTRADWDAFMEEGRRLDYEAAERAEREWIEAGCPDRSGPIIFAPVNTPLPTEVREQ